MLGRHVTGARMGLASASALIAGNMIGAGVFTTSGYALETLGDKRSVLLAWILGGGIALCGAAAYGELARRMPSSGGEYFFLSRQIHPLAGFLAGWISLLAGFTAPIAAAAQGLEAYWAPPPGYAGWLGALVITLAGAAHGLWPSLGRRLQDMAVWWMLAAIVGLLVLGLAALLGIGESDGFRAGGEAWSDSPHGFVPPEGSASNGGGLRLFGRFGVSLVWISFAYSGWNAAVYVASEVEAPAKTVPRATLWATGGVVLVYVAMNALILAAVPAHMLAGRAEVGALAAEALAGKAAAASFRWLVGLGLVTSISAMLMVGPRVYAQMANDGWLPSGLRSSSRGPRRAVALQTGLALLVFGLSQLREVLLYSGFLLSLSAAASVLGLLRRPRRADGDRCRAPLGWPIRLAAWVFAVSTLASAVFMVLSQPREAAAGALTLGAGACVYAARVSSGRGRFRGLPRARPALDPLRILR